MPDRPRVVAVVQARMGSTRLPGKILLDMAGAPLLERLVERVRWAGLVDRVIVATGDGVDNDPIEALCDRIGCEVFRGSEDDVLARVMAAAGDADAVVRLTADNPFVDGALIDFVLTRFLAAWPDIAYASNTERSGFPYGLFVEVAAMWALRRAAQSEDPMDREHVTWYIRQRPDQFATLAITAPVPFANDSLTIDTPQDYQRLKPVFEDYHRRKPDFTFSDIADWGKV